MAYIYFKETQKLNLRWKWIFFIALYIIMFWALYYQMNEKFDFSAVISITFSLCMIFLLNIVVITMKLETEIDESRIIYRYKPFHLKPKIIYWNEVSDFYIRIYKPYKEYGGYGLQRKMKYGRAFTVSGKTGLQLLFKDGKKILIGTQKPKEIEMIVGKIKSRTN